MSVLLSRKPHDIDLALTRSFALTRPLTEPHDRDGRLSEPGRRGPLFAYYYRERPLNEPARAGGRGGDAEVHCLGYGARITDPGIWGEPAILRTASSVTRA